MSSPTPGSDQNYPQGGVPQGQPGWGAPQGPQGGPAPSYGTPAGSGGPAGQRPGQVTGAAIVGIVIGGLGTLFGLIGLLGIGLLFAFDAVLGLLALLSLATAVVVLIGGIQTLQGKSPRLLLLGSYASIGISLLYLLWAVISGWGFAFSGLLSFVAPIAIVFLLMQPQSKQYFASRGMSY